MKSVISSRPLCLLLLCLLLLTTCSCASVSTTVDAGTLKSESCVPLEAYIFDAGKADAILLTTESGAVLIDCGVKGFGQTILDRLAEKGVSRIDYLIVTHFDKDHVGGAAKVINNFPVGTVLQSNQPKDSEEYEKYLKALNNEKLEAVTVRQDYDFALDGVRFTVSPPRKSDYKSDDSNNSSLIVTVCNGKNVLLFMGDAEEERLEEYLKASPVDCDLLKLPHHGADDAFTDDLIAAVKPELAVITCSDEEPESEITMMLLADAGAESFLTRVSAVKVFSDGNSIAAEYEK